MLSIRENGGVLFGDGVLRRWVPKNTSLNSKHVGQFTKKREQSLRLVPAYLLRLLVLFFPFFLEPYPAFIGRREFRLENRMT